MTLFEEFLVNYLTDDNGTTDDFVRDLEALIAEEREACAKVAEEYYSRDGVDAKIAAAIRRRGACP